MYRIRRVELKDHPVLGNLALDFTDRAGNVVDTVIFAGENGTGKSTILDVLYSISSHSVKYEMTVFLDVDGKLIELKYYKKRMHDGKKVVYVNDGLGLNTWVGEPTETNSYPFHGIYSDVEINFRAKEISSVTSLVLDGEDRSRRSTGDLPTQIKQLLVDIQALDDAEIARAIQESPDSTFSQLNITTRIGRFKDAFSHMFTNLAYSHVHTSDGKKQIIFKKTGKDIPIDMLSSGEKQIVYRGCFLLKDANALNGAFVFIDEPEISLHPKWQEKIMDYYKGIFTDVEGTQTSQIFAVTHSPFIIHNQNRRNDKVIVMSRNDEGNICVSDKREYYQCTTISAIEDAFSISEFSAEKPTVYVEGCTDEKYFRRAIEVFQLDVPFEVEWIGYKDGNGQDRNTGDEGLRKAYEFFMSKRPPAKKVCLFDSDTKRGSKDGDNIYMRTMQAYPIQKDMNKGIENALVLDDIDISPFYKKNEISGNYGGKTIKVELDKVKLCEYLCSLDSQDAQKVLLHLKEYMVNTILPIFET